MGYRILGYVVWNGAKWYVRRRYGGAASRKAAALGIVGAAVVALAVAGRKRSGSS
jgi:hypothetical protein